MKTFKEIREEVGAKVTPRDRSRYASETAKLGIDGNGRFYEVSASLTWIQLALKNVGLSFSDLISKDLLMGPKGHRTFEIENLAGEKITNSLLVLTWTELSPHKVEVVTYLS